MSKRRKQKEIAWEEDQRIGCRCGFAEGEESVGVYCRKDNVCSRIDQVPDPRVNMVSAVQGIEDRRQHWRQHGMQCKAGGWQHSTVRPRLLPHLDLVQAVHCEVIEKKTFGSGRIRCGGCAHA